MRKALLIFILLPLSLVAQVLRESPGQVEVSGRVIDQGAKVLPGANVVFRNLMDTTAVIKAVTDAKGTFTVQLSPDTYELRVSYLGYQPFTSHVEARQSMSVNDIRLVESATTLKEFTVVGRSLTYNVEGYKLNVENNALFKQQDLDRILLFLPGAMREKDNLKIYGKMVGKVYINRREIKLTGKDLLDYLQNYHGKNVKEIQVITSAGANESAAIGGTAVLKIITTKIEDGGMLSMRASGSYNKQSQTYGNPSLIVQQRSGKWSVYGEASMVANKNKSNSESKTLFTDSGAGKQEWSSSVRRQKPSPAYTVGAGYDLTPDDILTLEVGYHGYKSEYESSARIQNLQNDVVTGEEHNLGLSDSDSRRASVSMDYVHTWKTGELAFAGSYSDSHSSDDSRRWREGNAELWSSTEAASSDYASLYTKLDFEQRFQALQGKLKAGVAFSNWDNDSHTDNLLMEDGRESPYGTYDDVYTYKEQTLGMYGSYDFMIKSFSASLGLRYEFTKISPNSTLAPEANYTSYYRNFFPNVRLNYTINPMKGHNINLSYARKIQFPFMNMLNPGTKWSNEYSYSKGNPYLKPMCGNEVTGILSLFGNYSLSVTYAESPLFQLLYSKEEGRDIYYSTYENGGKDKFWVIGLSAVQFISPKWMVNATVNRTYVTTSYQSQNHRAKNWNITLSSTNNLPWGLNLNTNLFYVSPTEGIHLDTGHALNISASLSKSFLKDRLTATIDYGYSPEMSGRIHTAGVVNNYDSDYSPHKIGISLRYVLKWGNQWAKVRKAVGAGDGGRLK